VDVVELTGMVELVTTAVPGPAATRDRTMVDGDSGAAVMVDG
jgi:hypothetical protein